MKFQERDALIGIWNWAKSNQEYKLLFSKLGVSQTNHEQILIDIVKENLGYDSNNTARLYSYLDQNSSILFKESQIFEIYILNMVRRWTVNSIVAKYDIDSHTVIEWDKHARKEIKRILTQSKYLHLASKGNITNDRIEEVSSFLKEKLVEGLQ